MLDFEVNGKTALRITDDNKTISYDKDVEKNIKDNSQDGHNVEFSIQESN